jgi:hypothetical protein
MWWAGPEGGDESSRRIFFFSLDLPFFVGSDIILLDFCGFSPIVAISGENVTLLLLDFDVSP